MMSSQRNLPRRVTCLASTLAFTLFLPAAICGSSLHAQAFTPAHPKHLASNSTTALTPGEVRATRAFDAARKAGPPEFYAFLKNMPKGADLHMHLSGAVYAETIIAEAARQGLCVGPVDPGTPAVPVGHDAVQLLAPQHNKPNDCAPGQVPATGALTNQPLYDNLVDSFSMRAFVPTEGINGHDQFFATFARFGALKGDDGEWLANVTARAANQNEQYLEVMNTPPFSHAATLAHKLGWPAGAEREISREQLARLRKQLLAAGLRDEVPPDEKEFAQAEAARDRIEHCPSADAGAAPESSTTEHANLTGKVFGWGCQVKIRWLYQVLRGFPPQQVFAQTLLGFEVASADPDVVGVNFVMPEDGYLSMRDYHLQMQMLDYLHSVYPSVNITLHAGELAFGMVPPEGLSFHIRQAVELGHARRIGHGVDILYEDHPYDLLREMAAQHIMVEINLTSNAVILGISGKDHPLHAYMAAHVPWALSTDDEGVSRSDLTGEYVEGALTQDLTYADLKQSARTSLEHAFLHGQSLWAAPDVFTRRVAPCAAPIAPVSTPSAACAAFLNANEKAAQQWELERRFATFEATAH